MSRLMTTPFVAQLAELCRSQITRTKWVIVPTHAIGRTLGERLAREGTNWMNLRFVTPLELATRMGAPFLVEQGIDPSEDGLGPALMMRLLMELPEEDGYFRPLADQPSMGEALWATVRELRMAGVTSGDLAAGAFTSEAKHRELQALVASYEAFLEREKRGDQATVYLEALDHPEWCPLGNGDCWVETPDVVWTALQRRLIERLPGERLVPRACEIDGQALPRRMRVAEVARTAIPANPKAIDLFHAAGREAEIEEVFRRILASGAPLDHVEIACASESGVTMAWEKALRLEWPATVGPGVPAATTRPGRALIGFCNWIEGDFTATDLRRLLESGDIALPEERELSPGRAARLLVKSEAGWGRATYGLSLSALARDYAERAKNREDGSDAREYFAKSAAEAERLRGWIDGWLQAIPESEGAVALQAVVDAVLVFLKTAVAASSALDAKAAAALIDNVTELRALGDFQCPLESALRFVRERAAITVGGDRARPGHLFISSLGQAGYAGRRLTFVTGLEEGRVFPAPREDAVLLDRERKGVSDALRLSADRVDEAVWQTLARLADIESVEDGRVCFSYSSRDLREYRETYASWLMLRAFRRREGDDGLSFPEMRSALGEPASVVPPGTAQALSDGRWWLGLVKGAGEAGGKNILAAFPAIARGREASDARDSDALTEFDGFVPDAGIALDPIAEGNVLSATQLEHAAECPFRHFLQRALGVRPLDERQKDQDVWLDPLTRGGELHDLFARFMRRMRDENRAIDGTRDRAWLRETAEARLDALRVEMPPPSEEVLDRESRDFLADVDQFFDAECERDASRVPVGFEVGFGMDDAQGEALSRKEPVTVDLGKGLRFQIHGRIDRIDQIAEGVFEVIDYKTGSYFEPKFKGTFRGGRLLQHALYGLAATELLKKIHRKPQVAQGVYYFPSYKGGLERRVIPAPSKAALARVLEDLRDVIASGAFAHARDHGDCRFCDMAPACGAPASVDRVEVKVLDKVMESRVRLGGHD